MDETLRHDNPNPYLTANLLSRLWYCWVNPVLTKGYKGWLEESDMYNVCPRDSSKTTGGKLQAAWSKELERQKHGKQASFSRALFRAFIAQYMFFGIVCLYEEMVRVTSPVLLAAFLDYFSADSNTTRTEAWLYATGVILCSISSMMTHHIIYFGTTRMGMRLRISSCSIIFNKSLRLSNKALNECSIGQIVNMMSNDVSRFDQGMQFFHYLWIGPIQCLAVVIYLWYRLGPAVMSALAVMILLMPAQLLYGKLLFAKRRKLVVHTDNRVKVMNEIISGIRIIKLYCWEKPFGRLVEKLRSLEITQLRRTRRNQTFHVGPYFAVSQISILFFIMTYIVIGREDELRPGTIFMLMGMLESLRLTMGMFIPLAAQYMAEALVVFKRIQNFLLLEELKKVSSDEHHHAHIGNGVNGNETMDKPKSGVKITNLVAKWSENNTTPNTLDDITLTVAPASLVAVIGPVGAGKTSLLMSILGELPAQAGTVRVKGKIAYVSQHPWIFSGSLRQNILFGQAFNKTRYDKIIRISALSRDLTILPKEDATLIGDRGVNLSGGQKARVSLARALYMDADIYLLDDPLAAVDTTVGKHIFDKCIMGYLKDKPRLLVTHQIQLLPTADNIVILTDGQIKSQGTYPELAKSGVDFSELLKPSENETREKDKYNQDSAGEQDESGSGVPISDQKRHSVISADSLGEDYVVTVVVAAAVVVAVVVVVVVVIVVVVVVVVVVVAVVVVVVVGLLVVVVIAVLADIVQPDSVQLPEEEERETGNIDLQVFIDYIKAGANTVLFVATVLFLVLAQVILVGGDWWLARWTNSIADRDSALKAYSQNSVDQNMANMTGNGNRTNTDIPEIDTYFNLYVFVGIIVVMIAMTLARAFLFFKFAANAGENLHNTMFARVLRATMSFFDTNPVGRVLNRFSKDTGQVDDQLPWIMFDFFQSSLVSSGFVVVACAFNPWVFIPVLPLLVIFIIVRRYYAQTSRSVKRLEGTTRSPVFSHLSATLQGLHTIRAMHMEQQLAAEFDAHQDLHTEAWFLFLATSRWLGIRLDCLSACFVICVVYFSLLVSGTMDPGFVGLSVVYSMNLMGLFQWTVRQSVELENQMISVERVLQYARLPIEADLESSPGHKPPDTWPSSGSLKAKGVSLRYSPSAPFVLKDINFDIHGGEKIGIVGRTGAGKSSLITALFRLAEPEGELTIDGVCILSLGLHDLRKVISIIPQVRECTDELIQQTIRNKFKTCTVLTIAHRLHTIIDSDRIMVLDAGKLVEMGTPTHLLSLGKDGWFYSMVEQLGKTELEHLTEIASKGQHNLRAKSLTPNGTDVNHLLAISSSEQGETELPYSNEEKNLISPDPGHKTGIDYEAFTEEDTRL
ncbi:multidrug resistance-associated protein 4-like [Elysia marginata]|uniref:Cystic fibrosis transmembrane conductance regulator n=1 Tax=Elysia marginata TaxID=1093978 RepID=A0AAV4J0N5_9GAST|nr:multidrug resistance-associated protein 4-like [Elysia marginata]